MRKPEGLGNVQKRRLTETDVSIITQLSKATLRTNRCRRVGIPSLKLRGAVRYREEDVLAYIDAAVQATGR